MDIFSSTIIPTVNRATLARAAHSVLDQEFTAADFEVIVVNDSGQPLPDAEWQHSPRVRVIDTQRRERSVARNTGAAIARGRYLHFLDDDDIILPGALCAVWQASQQHPEAAWLYGAYRTVDNNGNLIREFHAGIQGNIFAWLVDGEGIPFQCSWLHAKYFYAAGTFDPNITGVEDRDLGRRIAFLGEACYIDELVAQVRIGEQGSTTNWKILREDDRWAREKALRSQGAFMRIRASAHSPYWRGRASHAYFASAVWNLQRGNFMTAASRLLAGLAMMGPHILSGKYWLGLRQIK